MKKVVIITSLIVFFCVCIFSSCSVQLSEKTIKTAIQNREKDEETIKTENINSGKESVTEIELSDDEIKVDGVEASNNVLSSVYVANDIVFYLENKGFTYGEGKEKDEHSQQEADKNNVIHIGAPGTYKITGSLSQGQIAVDLGDSAVSNSDAVVNLVLDDVDISCAVASAIVIYNVYECGAFNENSDIQNAGINIIVSDNTENNIYGSYVSKIYKSYELNKKETKVKNSEKLHKYDGAISSKMSINFSGENDGTGVLNVKGVNEGISSDYGIAINSGNINVLAGNDGINANKNKDSVIIINGGKINTRSDGSYKGGDGIDSNGRIVINNGIIMAEASFGTDDCGLDSDEGIVINGGVVYSAGGEKEIVSENSKQTSSAFSFSDSQKPGLDFRMLHESGEAIAHFVPNNSFDFLLVSCPDMVAGDYCVYYGEKKLSQNLAETINDDQKNQREEQKQDSNERFENEQTEKNTISDNSDKAKENKINQSGIFKNSDSEQRYVFHIEPGKNSFQIT